MKTVEFNGAKIGGVQLLTVYGNENTIATVARVCRGITPEKSLSFSDESNKKLVKTLLNLKHYRPFEFAGVIAYFEAPIFIERQFRTYRKPDIERSLRSCAPIMTETENEQINAFNKSAVNLYENLLENGMRKEEARRVLPLNTSTAWYSFFNIRSLLHIFEERIDAAAQAETRAFAEALKEEVKIYFPTIFED